MEQEKKASADSMNENGDKADSTTDFSCDSQEDVIREDEKMSADVAASELEETLAASELEEDVSEEGDWADKKKSRFKRKEKKDKTKEQLEELTDKLKRQMAEFDNFRKRTEKEKAAMYEIGAKSVVEKILPVIDSFERGLQAAPQEGEANSFVEGMDKIYKQLMTELANIGVVPIEAIGQEFNPDYHNAVMQIESNEYESGVIAQELQKGYMYRESVVRHSMVAVVE